MKKRKLTIYIGSISSVLLLVVFFYLQKTESPIINLPAQWLALSVLPLVLSLILSGEISQFKGFGFEIQAKLKEPITSLNLKATEAIADFPEDQKRSINYLRQLDHDHRMSLKLLSFTAGKADYYKCNAIAEYIERLPNLDSLVIKDKQSKYICTIDVSALMREGELASRKPDSIKVEDFIRALESETILSSEFASSATTLTVSTEDSIQHVARKLSSEAAEKAAVITPSGIFKGIALLSEVNRRIVEGVLSSV